MARSTQRALRVAADASESAERRIHRRVPFAEISDPPLVQIPSRGAIRLVDLSPAGALLEVPFQLRPGAKVMLELHSPNGKLMVPFHLLRCEVSALGDTVRYHAAGSFEHELSFLGSLSHTRDSVAQRRLAALESFQQMSRDSNISSHGRQFNELLPWVVAAMQRGDPSDLVLRKIEDHLHELFPSLVIGANDPTGHGDTSTMFRAFDLEFHSSAPLSGSDRRFLRASAQLMSLLDQGPPSHDVASGSDILTIPEQELSMETARQASDWLERTQGSGELVGVGRSPASR